MTELLTSAQMRAIEGAAIESGAVTGLELMERAGRRVVEAVFREWPELAQAPHRAVVLCGPGNNGGDGFVIARLLKEWGWEVAVSLYGDAGKLPPDARVNYERWAAIGAVASLEDDHFDGAFEEGAPEAIVIDALFGTGLTRPFLATRRLSMSLNGAQSRAARGGLPKVVAVDVPSGLCADSGHWLGDDQPMDFAGLANLTISFHRAKLGHLLHDGPVSCGKLVVADIGLEGSGRSRADGGCLSGIAAQGPAGRRSQAIAESPAVPPGAIVDLVDGPSELLGKQGNDHKFSHGQALILSGGMGRSGAARLAARGALRVGAGLVTVGAPGAAMMECAAQLTAIMLRRCDDGAGLAALLEDKRINALCLGPGLGFGDGSRSLLEVGLKSQRSCVLDADALSAIAQDEALFALLHANCVLTPHAGEFARLFPDLSEKLNEMPSRGPAYSKVDATRAAARRAGCVVLFKGADTVIAAPDGQCRINAALHDRAAPWLATAGSGDVLAGFIAGLLARGHPPMQAAENGAWLHVDCALKFGPGLIAEDIPEQLPQVFRDLGL